MASSSIASFLEPSLFLDCRRLLEDRHTACATKRAEATMECAMDAWMRVCIAGRQVGRSRSVGIATCRLLKHECKHSHMRTYRHNYTIKSKLLTKCKGRSLPSRLEVRLCSYSLGPGYLASLGCSIDVTLFGTSHVNLASGACFCGLKIGGILQQRAVAASYTCA